MNAILADALASTLSSLNFISRAAGCVDVLSRPLGNDKFQKIPASKVIHKDAVASVIDCNNTADYYDLVPTNEEIGILYFEDLGARSTATTASGTVWKGSLQLVCWLNYNRIGTVNAPGTIQQAVRSAIPQYISQSGYFLGGTIKVSQEPRKSSNPFKKYDYDELKTQYFMHPFDYFTMIIQYTTVISKECPVTVDITPLPC